MSEFKTVTEALGTGALALAPKATEAPPQETANDTPQGAEIPAASEIKKPITEFVASIIPSESEIGETAGKYAEKLDTAVTDGTKAVEEGAKTIEAVAKPTQGFIKNSVAISSVEQPVAREKVDDRNDFQKAWDKYSPFSQGDWTPAAIPKPDPAAYDKSMPNLYGDKATVTKAAVPSSKGAENATEADPNKLEITNQTDAQDAETPWEVKSYFIKNEFDKTLRITEFSTPPTNIKGGAAFNYRYAREVDPTTKDPIATAKTIYQARYGTDPEKAGWSKWTDANATPATK